MTPMRTMLLVAATAAIALALGAGVAWWRLSAGSIADNASAALFSQTLPDADGQPQPLAQWRGGWLVVNFWATWCPPCVEEMPGLQIVRDEYRGLGVEVVGIGIDNPDKVRDFRTRLGLTFPLLVAGLSGSELGRALGNPAGALPYTVLVSPTGGIEKRKLGQLRPSELKEWLDARLNRPQDPK